MNDNQKLFIIAWTPIFVPTLITLLLTIGTPYQIGHIWYAISADYILDYVIALIVCTVLLFIIASLPEEKHAVQRNAR